MTKRKTNNWLEGLGDDDFVSPQADVDKNQIARLKEKIRKLEQEKALVFRDESESAMDIFGCTADSAGLVVSDDISENDFYKLANLLFAMEQRIQVFIGDALVAAEALGYGDISEIASHFGYNPKTLWNWKSTALKVQYSLRREVVREVDGKALGISHYELVQKMDRDEQKAWLVQAREKHWSVAKLRNAIRQSRNEDNENTGTDYVKFFKYTYREFTVPKLKKLSRQERDNIRQSLNDIIKRLDQAEQS